MHAFFQHSLPRDKRPPLTFFCPMVPFISQTHPYLTKSAGLSTLHHVIFIFSPHLDTWRRAAAVIIKYHNCLHWFGSDWESSVLCNVCFPFWIQFILAEPFTWNNDPMWEFSLSGCVKSETEIKAKAGRSHGNVPNFKKRTRNKDYSCFLLFV